MDEYLEMKTDYMIVLQSSFLTFFLYWINVPFFCMYSLTILFIVISVAKPDYPVLYSKITQTILVFCGICMILKLVSYQNNFVNDNLERFRLVFDRY